MVLDSLATALSVFVADGLRVVFSSSMESVHWMIDELSMDRVKIWLNLGYFPAQMISHKSAEMLEVFLSWPVN